MSTLTPEYQNQWYMSILILVYINIRKTNDHKGSTNKTLNRYLIIENTETMKIRAVEMNDYDEEALVARSRCNHTLGRNEAAIEDGELQVSTLFIEQVCFECFVF